MRADANADGPNDPHVADALAALDALVIARAIAGAHVRQTAALAAPG
ncbi:MAG: hypothetical protein ACYDHH_07865 [Solirubrobacteraceae bacterium]